MRGCDLGGSMRRSHVSSLRTAAVQQGPRYVAQQREAQPSGVRAPGYAAPQREVPPCGERGRRHAVGEPELRHAAPGRRHVEPGPPPPAPPFGPALTTLTRPVEDGIASQAPSKGRVIGERLGP